MRRLIFVLIASFFCNLGFAQSQIGSTILGSAHNDKTGNSVAISALGDTVVVGSPVDVSGKKGYVKVYYNNNGTWTQIGSTIFGDNARDGFGQSVAISKDGSIIAVGAYGGDYVRLYKLTSGTWQTFGTKISGTLNTSFGWRVALAADGETVAISAIYDELTGQDDRGIVRVYDYVSALSTWSQRGSNIVGEADNDFSGIDIDISDDGDRIIIGAHKNDGAGSGVSIGHARVYDYNTNWTQLGADIDGEAYGDESGSAVSISGNGNRVAIGAVVNKGGTSNYNVGHVRVYELNSGWGLLGADIDGNSSPSNEYFGTSVSLNFKGNRLLVGAQGSEKAR
jgi:hypothetical protein